MTVLVFEIQILGWCGARVCGSEILGFVTLTVLVFVDSCCNYLLSSSCLCHHNSTRCTVTINIMKLVVEQKKQDISPWRNVRQLCIPHIT